MKCVLCGRKPLLPKRSTDPVDYICDHCAARMEPKVPKCAKEENDLSTAKANNKLASSSCPHYHLIPESALTCLAERYALGQERKKEAAWNAMSKNQEVLESVDDLIARMNHVIKHAYKILGKIAANDIVGIWGDAGAIMWGGSFAAAFCDKAKTDEYTGSLLPLDSDTVCPTTNSPSKTPSPTPSKDFCPNLSLQDCQMILDLLPDTILQKEQWTEEYMKATNRLLASKFGKSTSTSQSSHGMESPVS